MKILSFLSPFFLARHYLVGDIRATIAEGVFKGTVIDIGCGSKPYAKYFTENGKVKRYYGIDFCAFSPNKDFPQVRPDYFFDKEYLRSFKLPFKEGQFDNAVSFQVLEHHQKPWKMISEMVRIVEKRGYLMVSFPFIWSLHEVPHDYYRFTEHSVKNWFIENDCKVVKIYKEGSIFSTFSMLLNEEINTFASKSKKNYFVTLAIYPLLLVFQYISYFLDKICVSHITFFNYLILAKKNN